jgi:hypothetical protein
MLDPLSMKDRAKLAALSTRGGIAMRAFLTIGLLAIALPLGGCGSGGENEPEEPPMKVEDTAFGDLVGTQDQVRDRTNAAVDLHRESLDSRIEADEDAPAPPEE